MRFIGDTKLMEWSGLHKVKVRSECEAQRLIDELMDFVGWKDEKVSVFYEMRDNQRTMAIYTRKWGDPEIRIKSIQAREVGTLIHELAHHRVNGHGKEYKLCQQMLIMSYLKMKGDKRYELLVASPRGIRVRNH